MLKRHKTRIIIAAILAIVAGFSAFSILGAIQGKTKIVVAAADLESYTMLTAENLKLQEVSSGDRERYFSKAASSPNQLVGMVIRRSFKAGEPIQINPESVLTDQEKANVLNNGKVDKTAFIPYDKRVVSVEVDEVGAVSEQLKKGDFVDVIYSSNNDNTGGAFSNMMLQHIQIYGIEKTEAVTQGGMASKKKRITLLASPEECLKITVAKRNGIIDLVLNPLEGDTYGIAPINIMELAAREPLEKRALIENYIGMFKDEKEISEVTKNQLIASLEQEKDIESVKRAVQSANINATQKNELLEKLGIYNNSYAANAKRDIGTIYDTVSNSRLSDHDKNKILEMLDKYSSSIQGIEKGYDIDRIVQEINASQMDITQKQKLTESLSKLKKNQRE